MESTDLLQQYTHHIHQDDPELGLIWTELKFKFQNQHFYKKLLIQQSDSKFFRMSFQSGKTINYKMRSRLAHWLQELTFTTYQLSCLTFILAMQILDKYLSLTNQHFSQLQLIGSAALYLSSKVIESKIIDAQSYVLCAGSIFTKQSLEKKQRQIFKTLNFNLTFANPLRIFNYFVRFLNSKISQNNIEKAQKMIVSTFFKRQYEGISQISLGFYIAILAVNDKLTKQE